MLEAHPGALVLLREFGVAQALCCFNLRDKALSLRLEGLDGSWRDLVDGGLPASLRQIELEPYQVLWLERE